MLMMVDTVTDSDTDSSPNSSRSSSSSPSPPSSLGRISHLGLRIPFHFEQDALTNVKMYEGFRESVCEREECGSSYLWGSISAGEVDFHLRPSPLRAPLPDFADVVAATSPFFLYDENLLSTNHLLDRLLFNNASEYIAFSPSRTTLSPSSSSHSFTSAATAIPILQDSDSTSNANRQLSVLSTSQPDITTYQASDGHRQPVNATQSMDQEATSTSFSTEQNGAASHVEMGDSNGNNAVASTEIAAAAPTPRKRGRPRRSDKKAVDEPKQTPRRKRKASISENQDELHSAKRLAVEDDEGQALSVEKPAANGQPDAPTITTPIQTRRSTRKRAPRRASLSYGAFTEQISDDLVPETLDHDDSVVPSVQYLATENNTQKPQEQRFLEASETVDQSNTPEGTPNTPFETSEDLPLVELDDPEDGTYDEQLNQGPNDLELQQPKKRKPYVRQKVGVPMGNIVQGAWARRREIAALLTEEILKADQAPIPEGASRLICAHQEEKKPGNLILSADQLTLEFIPLDRDSSEPLAFSIQVNTLERDPTVSVRKANPMTIRFKVIDESGTSTDGVAFIIAQSDEGHAAMTEFREKVVAAREVAGYPEVVTANAAPAPRPYQCEKCSSTFKNKNGLEYHLQKSQTACNPNFDVEAAARVAQRKEEKAKQKEARAAHRLKKAEEAEVVRTKRTARTRGTPRKVHGEDDYTPKKSRQTERNESSESEDSIFEWAEQVSKNRTRASGPQHANRKQYRALPGEIAYLTELAERLAEQGSIDSEERQDTVPAVNTSQTSEETDLKQADPPIDPGILTQGARSMDHDAQKDSAQDLDQQDVQMLETPDEFSSIPPAVADKGELTPEVCQEIMLHIINSNGGVFPGDRSIWFAFVAVWLKEYRNSATLPESKISSNTLDDLLEAKKIRKFDYAFRDKRSRDVTRYIYLSDDYSKKEESFAQLREVMKEQHPKFYIPDGYAPPPVVLDRLEQVAVRNPRQPPPPKESGDESSSSSEDEVSREDAKERRKQNISKGVIAWHVRRRAAGLEPELSRKTLQRHARIERRRMEAEESERKYLEDASSPAWLEPASTSLQNPATGAWSRSFVVPRRKKERLRRHVASVEAVGFVESITLMQTEDGSWSFRPEGHGILPTPVRSRPRKAQLKRRLELDDEYSDSEPFRKRRRASGTPQEFDLDESQDEDFVPRQEELQDEDDDLEASDFDESQSSRQASDFHDLDELEAIPRKRARRQTRGTRRSALRPGFGIHSIIDATFFEPEKLEPGSLDNPGLLSLPVAFGFEFPDGAAVDETAELPTYKSVYFVPSAVVDGDSVLGEGSWVSQLPNPLKPKYTQLEFTDETSFSIDTLPYQHLDDSEGETFSKRHTSSAAGLSYAGLGKVKRLRKMVPTRSQIAIPADFHGVTEDPPAAAKTLGVELYVPPSGEYQRKRLRLGNRMSAADETRFMVTVLVVRILVGGVDQFIDWVIVQTQFPHFSMNHLHKVWLSLSSQKGDLIDELGVDFQDAFLVAYQNGTLPSINYDKLLDYNWGKLVKWTMKNLDTSLTPKTHQLTANRSDLKKEYQCTEIDRNTSEAQTMYFSLYAPIYRRLDAAGSRSQAIPIDQLSVKLPSDPMDDLTLIKSWARATALTPAEMWNKKFAFNKLKRFRNDQLQNAIDILTEEKVVIRRPRGKSTTGRSFEGSDAFAAPLRRPIAASVFVEALNYKEYLDEQFRNGQDMLLVDYMGHEGSYMCISSLQAAGQLHLKYINIPNDPLGMGDDAHPYDTKRMPKAKIKWDIEMRPTSTYLFNNDNVVLQNMTGVQPPRLEGSNVIPAWFTIADEVFPDMWKRILVAVSITVALRSGISSKGLRMVLKPALEEWEIDVLLRWGLEKGIWAKADEDADEDGGEVDGWVVTRDWWLGVGRVVEEMDAETSRLKEVYEAKRNGKGKGRVVDGGDYDVDEEDLDDLDIV